MPNLTFVMPHWLYWIGLVAFPIAAMVVVRRRMAETGPRPSVTLAIGYMLLVGGGFIGLHRYYVKSFLGLIYIPLFLLILYGNIEGREQRLLLSEASNNMHSLERLVKRYEKRLVRRKSAATERSLERTKKELTVARPIYAAAQIDFDFWGKFSGGFAGLIALFLIFDVFRLPKLIRRTNEIEGAAPPPAPVYDADLGASGRPQDAAIEIQTSSTKFIDMINGWTGEFVAFWSIIAVFVYYYEVVARYVFNSPTNWAHEAMFLMFGMQYLIAGAYALREGAHVRVDVVYLMLPYRTRIITDIITSIFFFVFTITLLVTGGIFFLDAMDVFEVSFTEWAIQYWPVKLTMVIGAFLLVAQGFSKLTKDCIRLQRQRA